MNPKYDDLMADQFYESSEGWNDSERDRKLNELSDDQLLGLAQYVIELSMEKIRGLEADVQAFFDEQDNK